MKLYQIKAMIAKGIVLLKDCSGGIDTERYIKELLIDGVLVRLTSIFEGTKDIDKTLERLAVKNALADKEETKLAG